MRDSFVFYRSFAEACRELDPEDFKDAVLAMCDYAMDDKEPEVKGMSKAIFAIAKPILENNNKRYQNGTKGGRPKNQTETKPKPNHNQTETKPKPNRNQSLTNDKEQEHVKEQDKVQEQEKIKPHKERKTDKREIEVIEAYASDPVLNATIHEFIDFRKQIKAPMTDIALTKMLAKLDKIGKSDHERIEILNESMANGWKGIFPLDKVKPRKQEIDWEAL